jgi:CheY-like chemotaxis protein/HPt (histidine-containing phosphotransfer) domain-containing protein
VPLEGSEAQQPQPSTADAGRALHILLAEDNEVNQILTVQTLQKHGHTVAVAANGHEALTRFEAERFDAILMDVQMPEMDGLEATAAIRDRERATGKHIPIVALTAHAMKGDRERCLEAGMDGYVAKPVRKDELLTTLTRLVGPTGGAAPRSTAGGQGYREGPNEKRSSTAKLPVISTRTTVGSGFDLQIALARVEGDRELLRKMVRAFAAQADKLLAEIHTAVARGDAAALERAAHKLKGSLGNFGARSAAEKALRLEILGRGGDLTGADVASAELEQEIGGVRGALIAWSEETVT